MWPIKWDSTMHIFIYNKIYNNNGHNNNNNTNKEMVEILHTEYRADRSFTFVYLQLRDCRLIGLKHYSLSLLIGMLKVAVFSSFELQLSICIHKYYINKSNNNIDNIICLIGQLWSITRSITCHWKSNVNNIETTFHSKLKTCTIESYYEKEFNKKKFCTILIFA